MSYFKIFFHELPKNAAPLFTAVINKDLKKVKSLLKDPEIIKSINYSSPDTYYRTPLALACNTGLTSIALALLESGAEVNDSKSLHFASLNNHFEIVKLLIQHGDADIHAKNFDLTPLFSATVRSHIETVKVLIENGASVNERLKNSHSPLDIAAQKGHFEIVKLLIANGASVASTQSLELALSCKHVEIAKILIENGADVNRLTLYDPQTVLSLATEKGYADIVQMLIDKGADINIKDSYGYVPLHIASIRGDAALITLLVNAGANVDKQQST